MSDNREFIAEARLKCAMSIRNTAVGDWLGDALRRLEEADAENARLRQALEAAEKLASDRRYHIGALAQQQLDSSDAHAINNEVIADLVNVCNRLLRMREIAKQAPNIFKELHDAVCEVCEALEGEA